MEETKKRSTEFVTKLAAGEFSFCSGICDSAVKAALPEAALASAWTQLSAAFGNFKRIAAAEAADAVQGGKTFHICEVLCEFGSSGLSVRVVWDAGWSVAGLNFKPVPLKGYAAPSYVASGSFVESPAKFGSAWPLPGLLCLPVSATAASPVPGVVLLHGSGPNDRDETIGPNKVFKDLAWGLASRGIAVLRFDKRTLVHGRRFKTELGDACTVQDEVIDDALLALELLRKTPGVDPKKVFAVGHSLGATLTPRIAKQDPTIAGIVIMAGLVRPLEDTVLDQVRYLEGVAGEIPEEQKAIAASLKAKAARAKDPALSKDTPSSELPLGMSATYLLDLRHAGNPAAMLASLSVRALILQGGRDYQVLPDVDFAGWKQALEGKPNVTLSLLPSLNHLFIAGEGRSTPEEYMHEGHVDACVIETIATWIARC